MLVESSSIPKYRDLSQPGDDVVAIVPERLYAVFDGATDTTGNQVDGISPGRFAASQAALAMVRHVSGPQRGTLSATQLLAAMNASIASGLAQAGAAAQRAGSTAAIVEDVGDTLRFLIVGDSGLRLNGSEVFRFAKDVDVLYTAGRVATFRRLQALGHSGDALEVGARQLIFRGLDQSGQDLLSPADIDAVVSAARQTCAARLKPDAYELVEPMLRAGIAGGQYRFCNLPMGHSLAYGVLNGGLTQGPDVLSFWRPKAQVRSIELFTDGYLTRPAGTRVRDWEREFFRVEAEDFSKSGAYAGVKGSSSQFFSDDRSVLGVHCAPPDSGTY